MRGSSDRSAGQPRNTSDHILFDLLPGSTPYRRVGVDDEIERARQRKLVHAIDLAQDSLDSISHDRVSKFSGHGESYAAATQTIFQTEDCNDTPAHTSTLAVHPRELAA